MKIAIDATVLWGKNRYSGVEKVVDRVVRRMLACPHGHSLKVFVPSDWNGFEEYPGDEIGAAVVRLPFRGAQRLRRIVWQQIGLPLELRRQGSEVVVSPAYIMPLLSPCPAVVMVHDLHGLRRDRTRLENWLHHRLLLPPTLRRAAAIVAPTRAVMDELAPMTSPGRPRLVAPLGIDAIFTPADEPETPSGADRERYLLYVGNLEERKGLGLLLEAFARLRAPNLRLVIVGKDRGSRGMLERRAETLGIRRQVEFQGYVDRAALVTVYRGAAALAHPAVAEGFGMTPLEAMACGTPVVAVVTPAAAETLGGAACLSAADPARLAEALHRILSDGLLRREMVAAGLERAAGCSWEETTAIFWQAIEASSRS